MVDFSIIGDDFNPDIITNVLRLNPTEQYLKGEMNSRNICRKETCWSISTGYKESLYISDLLEDILVKFSGKEEILIRLKEELKLTFKFFIVMNIVENVKPAIYLDNRIIQFASNLNAEFDFDLYVLN